jgi:membrane protease YdiL (CAAX protease family)
MGERRHKVKEKIPAPELWKRIMGPVVRIVFAVSLVGGAVAAAQVAVKLLRDALSLGSAVPAAYYLVYLIVSVLVAYLTYRAYVRVVEKRSVTELSGAGAPRELGIGALIGLGMVAAIVGILWSLGYYRITGVNAWKVAFVLFANDGAGAFVEEIILRGIIFRITVEKLGTWMALGISVVLFSLLHLASPGVTVISTVVAGLEAGILLSAAYVLTRRLWLAIGIHFAWDFSHDAIFGVAGGAKGFVRTELVGPVTLTGGVSGIEGSVLALLACLAIGAYLLLRARRRRDFVGPSWRQQYELFTSAMTETKVAEQ